MSKKISNIFVRTVTRIKQSTIFRTTIILMLLAPTSLPGFGGTPNTWLGVEHSCVTITRRIEVFDSLLRFGRRCPIQQSVAGNESEKAKDNKDDVVRVRIVPRVLLAGQAMRVTCTVPRHPENRWLTFGIADLRSAGEELHGTASRVTYELLVERVPCDVGPAFCAVTRADRRTRVATQTFEIAGCRKR